MVGTRKLKAYYTLVKPGIIKGNLLTATAGFLFGANLHLNLWPLLATLFGTALVIASGCVFNNYLDRKIDKLMKRTKERALVTGEISARFALIYASVLGLTGVLVLAVFTNTLTTLLGLFGLFSYVVVYGYAKRQSVHGTLVGTLPGAMSLLAGYTAATGRVDVTFWLLFAIMVCWQMAHFYAIAIYRLNDYKAAKIPVMPAVYGIWVTKLQILLYATGFMLAIVGLARFSYAGIFYLAIMLPLCMWWILVALSGLYTEDNGPWARKVFFMSLIILTTMSGMLSINAWLP